MKRGRASPAGLSNQQQISSAGTRFGPPPGLNNLGVSLDLNIERDAYEDIPGSALREINQQHTNLAQGMLQMQTASLRKPEEEMQQSLRGSPKMAGLSTYEYKVDGGLRYYCGQPNSKNIDESSVQRYFKTFHRHTGQHSDQKQSHVGRKNIQIKTDKSVFSFENETNTNKDRQSNKLEEKKYMMELSINLPVQTMVEQIELIHSQNAQKYQLFKKYLRIAGVTRESVIRKDAIETDQQIGQDIQFTEIGQNPLSNNQSNNQGQYERQRAQKFYKMQSGYHDEQKKITEINLCGAIGQQVNILFEFNKLDPPTLEQNDNETLDHEVQNIANKKLQFKKPGMSNNFDQSNSSASDRPRKLSDLIRPDDIQIIVGDEIDQSDANNSQFGMEEQQLKQAKTNIPHDQTDEEKKLSEEKRLFEGTNKAVWAAKLIQQVIQTVRIVGFNTNKIFSITNLSHLMNCSFTLRAGKVHLEDAMEVDFLLGTLFISSKRNIQATEVLRNRVQAPYLKQIEANLAILQGNQDRNKDNQRSQKYQLGQKSQEEFPIMSNDDKENLKIQIKKLFSRAAIIELMCSESMCIRPQLNDKLQSLVRMTQLCRGQLVKCMQFGAQIFFADDEYTTMVKILPFMLKFTIQCIEQNTITCNPEIVVVSAIRNIQFILETYGCSLDSAMIFILKSILKNYPDRNKQDKMQKRARDLKEKIVKNNKESLVGSGDNIGKTLLSEGRRIGGINGTCSANELNLRQQSYGLNSAKEIPSMMNYQFNQISARGTEVNDQNKRGDQADNYKVTKFEKMSMIEQIFSLSWIHYRDEPQVKKEPNSGFEKTLMNLFNTLLDSYISVLSSISSHILHQIFYEVIVPCLTYQPFEEDKNHFELMDKEDQIIYTEYQADVKIYAVKIAEKIITICQGDLIMNRSLLDALVKAQSSPSYQNFKKQLEMPGQNEQYRDQLIKSLSPKEFYHHQISILWSSIRSKVFTNYSMKGFKLLIEWLVSKMSLLAANCTFKDGRSHASEIAMLELSEDDMIQLSQYLEIINYISVGRRNNQEEANQLIKIKHDYCMDLYLLLNPLLFWLDFSVEREERLGLFKQVYQTIKDVLENLPPKKVDIDILQIIIPILQRTSEYLRSNSPSLPKLEFLEIVLHDIREGKYCQTNYPDLKLFFLDQLNSIVSYIPFCEYEEIFSVFDKLLSLSQDVMTEKVLKRCISSLIDKATAKNRAHKASVQQFMKALMDSSINFKKNDQNLMGQQDGVDGQEFLDIYDQEIDIKDQNDGLNGKDDHCEGTEKATFFDVMIDFCFFENSDKPAKQAAGLLMNDVRGGRESDSMLKRDISLQFRSPLDLHELYVDKLQFFIDSLNLMKKRHINQYSGLLFNPKFKLTVFSLMNRGEINLRLLCHEILEILGTYFMQYCSAKTLCENPVSIRTSQERSKPSGVRNLSDHNNPDGDYEMVEVDYINHERMYIAQMMVQCVRKSFELNNGSDSYLQFNSLILLDQLFQNILPVPSFQNEQIKIIKQEELQERGRNHIIQSSFRMDNQILNESQLEDGSSGGEGTTGRAAAAAAARIRNRDDPSLIAGSRQLNPNYLGEIQDSIDLETLELRESTPEFEVTDPRYTSMRLKLVYKLWPYVQEALNSPWSNIRSICYGLICSMLKIDVSDCAKFLPSLSNGDNSQAATTNELGLAEIEVNLNARMQQHQQFGGMPSSDRQAEIFKQIQERDKELLEQNKFYIKLRQFVIPMMINLLSSKESESKAGGLNILGSICGLSYDYTKVKISKNLDFFRRNSDFISLPIWQLVFELQDDWDITIKEASIVLIQLCAPREAIKYFNKCKIDKENQKFQQMLTKIAKNGGGQGGHGSMSNLSSARQTSLYNHMNSKGSLNGLKKCLNENGQNNTAGDQSQRRIDYQNLDFGYKNKAIPNIPGLINDFGKIDIAIFLNDNQDMMNIDEDNGGSSEATDIQQNIYQFDKDIQQQVNQQNNIQKKKWPLTNSARVINQHNDRLNDSIPDGTHMMGGVDNNQLALDLDKISQMQDEPRRANIGFDVEAAFLQSSMSQRSNLFGNSNQLLLNQKILMESQQQNQNLAQAMQGSQFPNASANPMALHQQFDFFVDEYSDEQIQEIISIFRNDFKPPKNLWIEKAQECSVFNGPDIYAEIYPQAIEQFNQQIMVLQQKQQQDLQSQISSANSSPRGSPAPQRPANTITGMQIASGESALNSSPGLANIGEFSPPGLVESSQPTNTSQQAVENSQMQHGEQNIQDPSQTAQTLQQELKDGDMQIFERHVSTGQEDNALTNPVPNESQSQNQGSQAQQKQATGVQPSNNAPVEKFNPSTDLNIFEQINFDEMNINLEDINQSNQKQEVINSSNSDCGDRLMEEVADSQNQGGSTGHNLSQGQLRDMAINRGDIESAHQAANNLNQSSELSDDQSLEDESMDEASQDAKPIVSGSGQIRSQVQVLDQSQYYQYDPMQEEEELQAPVHSFNNEMNDNQGLQLQEHQNDDLVQHYKDIEENGFDENMVPPQATKHRRKESLILGQAQQKDNQDGLLDIFEKKNKFALQMIEQEKRHHQTMKFEKKDQVQQQPQLIQQQIQKNSSIGIQQLQFQQKQKQMGLQLQLLKLGSPRQVNKTNQTNLSSTNYLSGQEHLTQSIPTNSSKQSSQTKYKTQAFDMRRIKDEKPLQFSQNDNQHQNSDKNGQSKKYNQNWIYPQMMTQGASTSGESVFQHMEEANHGEQRNDMRYAVRNNIQQNKKSSLKEKKNVAQLIDFKNHLNQIQIKNVNNQIKQNRQGVSQKSTQQIESARLNFVKANIPLAPPTGNFGNFSHRVQVANNGMAPGSFGIVPNASKNFNQTSSVVNTKKQILKNLKQIKTNNEDYFIMQNISKQMGGHLTNQLPKTNGLNSTKNKKGDKSMENLIVDYQKGLQQNKSGTGTLLGRSNQEIQSDIIELINKQNSSDVNSVMGKTSKQQRSTSKGTQHRQSSAGAPKSNQQRHLSHRSGHTKSSGKSTSPVRQPHLNEIAKLLIGSCQSRQSKTGKSGNESVGLQKAKSHRGGSNNTSGGGTTSYQQNNTQQQYLQLQTHSHHQKNEKMRDLNYFIKTIEKFSKTTKFQDTSKTAWFKPPFQIASNLSSAATIGFNGGPQTPKDVLINMGDQLFKYHSSSANNKLLDTQKSGNSTNSISRKN